MPRSTKIFVEQAMTPSVWLHINGVSLTTDIPTYQPPVHSYDYRTKHLQSPVQPPTPPLLSPSAVVPYSVTMIDGPYFSTNQNKVQYQKFEYTDLPKKYFIDRQIKKAKSLPGLIKGTALSRHTPLQSSSTFTSPAPANPPTQIIQDDQLPMISLENEDDSIPLSQTNEQQQTETRRPRVYFADFNKIQIIDDLNDSSQQQFTHNNHYPHRRHRRRTNKKPSQILGTNPLSPSIQQTQILQNFPRSLPARQINNQATQELNIKKQQILVSPRAQSCRTILLPDILDQSSTNEQLTNENSYRKYQLQREKPLIRLPKPVIEIPSALAIDISTDNKHNDVSSTNELFESNEKSNDSLIHSTPSVSTTSINRQRQTLRTISLRQQFTTPNKFKHTSMHINSTEQTNPSTLTTRRSASLKHSILRIPDDTNDSSINSVYLSAVENRPSTTARTLKQLKRSDAIHMNSKQPLTAVQPIDLNKSYTHESAPERFQNLLTIVRAPYAVGGNTFDSSVQANHRPGRTISARDSSTLPLTSNIVYV